LFCASFYCVNADDDNFGGLAAENTTTIGIGCDCTFKQREAFSAFSIESNSHLVSFVELGVCKGRCGGPCFFALLCPVRRQHLHTRILVFPAGFPCAMRSVTCFFRLRATVLSRRREHRVRGRWGIYRYLRDSARATSSLIGCPSSVFFPYPSNLCGVSARHKPTTGRDPRARSLYSLLLRPVVGC